MIGNLSLAPRRRWIRPYFVQQNRNVRTYDVTESGEAMVRIAAVGLMLRRLELPARTNKFHYRTADENQQSTEDSSG